MCGGGSLGGGEGGQDVPFAARPGSQDWRDDPSWADCAPDRVVPGMDRRHPLG
ncbi:hypothetical protein ACFPRL_18130 [Pseudoclavibacter helvolus]